MCRQIHLHNSPFIHRSGYERHCAAHAPYFLKSSKPHRGSSRSSFLRRAGIERVAFARFEQSSAAQTWSQSDSPRSHQTYSKQVCLWDLAQILCIAFIIQVAWAI